MLNRYIKNNQIAGILSLGLGTIIAQLINLLVQPILTRTVTPEELGEYNFIISIANLIIPVASLKLTMLIVIDEENEEAEILTDVAIITSFIVTILSVFFLSIMLIIGNNIFSEIGYIVFLIPLMIITNAFRFIFISHNNRYKKYSLISRMDIIRELVKGLLQIVLGRVLGPIGLSLGYAFAPIVGLKFQSKDYINNFKKRRITSGKVILNTYKKYKKHIFYMVPSQFINTFSYTLLNISIISLFTAKEAGFYSISYMVLGLPLILISNNVSKVYLQNLRSLTEDKKSVWKNFYTVVGVLSIISIIGFSIMAIISPNVTQSLFGKEYDESGKYITILCFMFASRLIASSVMGTYVFFNKQNIEAMFQVLLVTMGIIVHYITDFFSLDIYGYLKLISLSYGVVYIMILVNIGFICKKNDMRTEWV